MELPNKLFPLQDVESDTVVHIAQAWGRPRPLAQNVATFLELGGRPAIKSDPFLGAYLNEVVAASVTDTMNVEQQVGAFQAGALLFSSMFTYVHGPESLQVSPNIILNVANNEASDVVTNSAQQINPDTAKNFRNLIGKMLAAFNVSNNYFDSARIGAGALQLVVLEQHRQRTCLNYPYQFGDDTSNPLAAFERDPHLADLRKLFEDFGKE